MKSFVAHGLSEETIEAKTRWFRSLPLVERMDLFCSFTNLALEANPHLPDLKNARSATGHIRIISKTDLIASKRATGRPVDLEDARLLEIPENRPD